MRTQERSKRKATGGRYWSSRGKRKYELVGFAAVTKIGEKRVGTHRTIGGNTKRRLLVVKDINVTDKKGKTQKTQVVNVVENTANQHLVRRNILTKGAVIETALGKVRITSRPGQEQSLNGRLV